jgi:hypothetical protein
VHPVLTCAALRDVAGVVGAPGSATAAADACGGSGRLGLASDDGEEETMTTTIGKEDRDMPRLASRNPLSI